MNVKPWRKEDQASDNDFMKYLILVCLSCFFSRLAMFLRKQNLLENAGKIMKNTDDTS